MSYPVDDGRRTNLELLMEFGFFLLLAVCALWITLWQFVGRGIMWFRRRRATRSQAEAVQPSVDQFDWWRSA